MRRGLAVAALTILAACGGGGGGGSPGTNPGPGPTPTAFALETVDTAGGDTGWFPSLAVEALGTVHVSYLDRANERFRYARRAAGGTWTRSDIADAGSHSSVHGWFSGVDYDSAGVPAVSFHDADWSYVYAKGNAAGTTWTTTLVPSPSTAYAFMGHNGIAIDRSTDTAHVVNWDYDSVVSHPEETVGTWTPGGSKAAVSGPANVVNGQLHHGIDCAVAVDSHGWPSFAYTSWNGLADPSAKNHVTWAQATGAATWTLRDVEEITRGGYGSAHVERWVAFAMGPGDRPHLAYYHYGLDRIRYATWTGSAWTIESIAQPSIYARTSELVGVAIAVDSAGTPHVAYYGLGNKVTYAKRTGANAWTTQVVDTSTDDTGHGVAIGVDGAGHVHIAYRDDTAASLKYARR